jgi:general secretion pathway protein G
MAALATRTHRASTAPRPGAAAQAAGFTLIELLVVLAILALLLTIATPKYIQHVERAREATLRSTLKVMRESIDKFAGDQGRFPASLDELVGREYLKAIPVDPITEKRDTWVVLTETELRAAARNASDTAAEVAADAQNPARPPAPGVAGVRSGAAGKGMDGSAYQDW